MSLSYRYALVLSVLGLLPLVGGCHHATEQDCQLVIDRITELELKDQGITDPAVIESQKQKVRTKKQEELMRGCVGRRVSVSAMNCIRSATKAEEITDKCLR